MAKAVEIRKAATVFTPIRPSFFPSPTSAAATTRRHSTIGATTMVRSRVRMVPSGFRTALGAEYQPHQDTQYKPDHNPGKQAQAIPSLKINPILIAFFLPDYTNRHTWSTAISENP
jgi:hypothetical protein